MVHPTQEDPGLESELVPGDVQDAQEFDVDGPVFRLLADLHDICRIVNESLGNTRRKSYANLIVRISKWGDVVGIAATTSKRRFRGPEHSNDFNPRNLDRTLERRAIMYQAFN